MLSKFLRQSIDRIPPDEQDRELNQDLFQLAQILARLAGAVSQARREKGGEAVTVGGLDLVVAETLDLAARCAELEPYQPIGVMLLGLVGGLASQTPEGDDGG